MQIMKLLSNQFKSIFFQNFLCLNFVCCIEFLQLSFMTSAKFTGVFLIERKI